METLDYTADFLKKLETLFAGNNEDALSSFRKQGWEKFAALKLPTKKTETYQYLPLNKLYGKSFKQNVETISASEVTPHVIPECKESVIVFLNGKLDLTQSNLSGLPKKVVLLPLKQALGPFGAAIKQQAQKLNKEEDPFAALNQALCEEPLFLFIPPNTVLEKPIQILHLVKGDGQVAAPRVEFLLGLMSEAVLIEKTEVLSGENHFTAGVIQVSLDERARLTYLKMPGKVALGTWQLSAFRGDLKKDSHLKTVQVNFGAETIREDYQVSLLGEGSEVSLNGISHLNKTMEAHTHVKITHSVENCQSLQLFKNILDDEAKASFEGKIYVKREAQKTNAFQLNNNLLLSERAQADSKPNLEIFADDVKASHGATFGQLDEGQLFYLNSRGIPTQTAKNLLIRSFALEVIDLLPDYLKRQYLKKAF